MQSGRLLHAVFDRPNGLRLKSGTFGPTLLSGTADSTLGWTAGIAYKLANGAATANRKFTLPVTGMRLNNRYRVTIEAQTKTVALVNGGAAGGNVCVLAAGFDGTIDVRLNESFNLERV